MGFNHLKEALQKNFSEITKDVDHLFQVDLDKDRMWRLYLDSFPEGTNEVFRERGEYDCSCCRQFIKNIGNVVTVKDGNIKTVWDFEINSTKYQPVINALSAFVKSKTISDVWVNKFDKIGVNNNFEKLEDGSITEWHHFYLELPSRFVRRSHLSEADMRGTHRDTRNVFKRSLDELSEESLQTVLELTYQNSLYKGEEWQGILTEFLKHKQKYDSLQTEEEKSIYAWEQSVKVGGALGRIRNHSIGTLLVDISEGEDLDTAVRKYEVIVAPENYKRSKPIYTKKMLEEAQKKVVELGYMESLERRYATLDDISVRDILFSNKDASKKISGANIFEQMASEASINPKKFSRVEEISIDKFVKDILPTAQELEVFLENKHESNMVSLIAPENKDSKSMFKWNNNFSWAYAGNITDSSMRERVKSAGGKVDGVLRFSIQWNDGDTYDGNDLDAHCIEPSGNEIYYGNKRSYYTTGELDVDIVNPRREVAAVENITWTCKKGMDRGVYQFIVNNYSHNGGRGGFKAEIEFNGQIYSFEYSKEVRHKEKVQVAEVHFDGEDFSIEEKLSSTSSTREIWGLNTNQFIPVSVVSYSPNYWGNNKTGNRHYLFMLKDCTNPQRPNGFFVEFLKEELNPHRKVFEALGAKMAVNDSAEQLSGIGFSSTQRNEVLVKVKSSTERVLKVKI